MKLNNLCDLEGAFKSKKRVGRGIGSGKGKTCGRGVKGQKSRSGVSINGFEGGQMPIYRRLPKRGFTNVFAKTYSIISLSAIQHAIDSGKLNPSEKLTQSLFLEAGLINKLCDGVKILADGELKAKIAVEVAKASKAAIEKVEKLGGTISFLTKTQEV